MFAILNRTGTDYLSTGKSNTGGGSFVEEDAKFLLGDLFPQEEGEEGKMDDSITGRKRTFSSTSINNDGRSTSALDLEGLGGRGEYGSLFDELDPFEVGLIPSFCEEPEVHMEFGKVPSPALPPIVQSEINPEPAQYRETSCRASDDSYSRPGPLSLQNLKKDEDETASNVAMNSARSTPRAIDKCPHSRKLAIQEVTQLPVKIMNAFNNGEIDEIVRLVEHYFVENCTVKTPACDVEKYGRCEVIKLYRAVFNDYPDAVMVYKDIRMTDKYDLKFKFYFTGTMEKPRPGEKPYSKGRIVSHINLSKYSPGEILQMTQRERELRETNKRIQVLTKGETHYHFNRSFKITSYEMNYTVTAFEDAAS
jgi:hypothetical protein